MSDQYDLVPANDVMTMLSQLTPENQESIRQILNERATESKLQVLQAENATLQREIEIVKAEGEERHKELVTGLKGVADAGARRMKHSDKYFVRTVLGKTFSPSISDKRMSKLLKVVGILHSYGEPRAEFQGGLEPLAKLKPYTDWPTWLFHAEKTTTRIDWWLSEHDYYDDFHNATLKDSRDELIDMLYEEYVS